MYEWLDRVGYTMDRAALHREFPDVAFHDFESWAKTQHWNALLQSAWRPTLGAGSVFMRSSAESPRCALTRGGFHNSTAPACSCGSAPGCASPGFGLFCLFGAEGGP